MTKDEALKLALEALELSSVTVDSFGVQRKTQQAITAIKEALAHPAQEPVAWRTYVGKGYYIIDPTLEEAQKNWPDKTHQPLYTTPQPAQDAEPDELAIAYMSGFHDGKKKRPWVGLTREESLSIIDDCRTPTTYISMIEAKLKEKNS